jgi:hypothetical protein
MRATPPAPPRLGVTAARSAVGIEQSGPDRKIRVGSHFDAQVITRDRGDDHVVLFAASQMELDVAAELEALGVRALLRG